MCGRNHIEAYIRGTQVQYHSKWLKLLLLTSCTLFVMQAFAEGSLFPEASMQLQRDAEQGNADAQFRLGGYYQQQHRSRENQQLAFKWMLAAARQGHVQAQVNVARYYKTGTGTEKSLPEALKWFSMASDQNHPAGHFGLGRMYYRGHGVDQDYARAFQLYELAARSGHASAQAALGYMVDNGLGVEANDVEALKWYLLSAEKWITANSYVYYMRQKMDEAAVQQARVLADQYRKKNYRIEDTDK